MASAGRPSDAGASPLEDAEIEGYLAQVMLERAEAALPLLLIALPVAVAITPLLGAPIPPWTVAANAALVAAGLVIFAALRRRRVPLGAAHAVAAAAWALAPLSTLAGQAGSGQPWLLMTLTIELMAAALQLSLRWAIASVTIAVALYVPLAFRDAGPLIGLFIAGVSGAGVAGCVMCLFLRRTMIKAERMRLHEQRATTQQRATAVELQATADALSRELAERQRAEVERERLREQFIEAQRLEAVGTLAAGMAHDMNNILAGIMGIAESMRDDTADAAIRDDCTAIVDEAGRGAALTRSLLAFSRRGQYRRQPTPIDAVIDQVQPLLIRTLPRGIVVRRTGATGAIVDIDPPQLSQAIINLSLNGADAMNGSGTLTIHTGEVVLGEEAAERLRVPPDQRWAVVAVSDTGHGMDDATRLRIFEPFFTTKSLGKGTGLGLAMVYGAIQGHAGAIEVETAPGRGSTFRCYLPIVAQPAAAAAPPPTTELPARERGTVLVVDDEPHVRVTSARMLERLGFGVATAANGQDALETFDRLAGKVDLVLLDMAMPVMDGAECFRQLRERSRVPVLIVSGFALDHEAQAMLTASAARFLDKPFTRAQLVDGLERLLARRVSAERPAVLEPGE